MPAPIDDNDKRDIDALVSSFFGAFSNVGGRVPDVGRIRDLVIAKGVISKCVGANAEIYSIDEFIGPRQELLTSGALREFQEFETSEQTTILGNVAQRVSTYSKSGILNEVPFSESGIKMFLFVKNAGAWRIASVAWDDNVGDEPGRPNAWPASLTVH